MYDFWHTFPSNRLHTALSSAQLQNYTKRSKSENFDRRVECRFISPSDRVPESVGFRVGEVGASWLKFKVCRTETVGKIFLSFRHAVCDSWPFHLCFVL